MKYIQRQFYVLSFIVSVMLLVLLVPVFAQGDADPTVQGPTVLSTSVPDTNATQDEGSLEFKLPPLNDEGYAWMYGAIIAEFIVIVVLVARLQGSVPLQALNTLLDIGKGVTRAIPGTYDDQALNWLTAWVKPGLDPNRWPTLVNEAAASGVISPAQASAIIANIQAQKLNPYQAYAQAESMLRYFQAEAVGAQTAKVAEFQVTANGNA